MFCAAVKGANADVIVDFDPSQDTIAFSHKVFKALAVGVIADDDAAYSTDGDAASAHIVYDSATGALFYDRMARAMRRTSRSRRSPPASCSRRTFLIV
jgi:Ca2+-binding RTX toxin-like protein